MSNGNYEKNMGKKTTHCHNVHIEQISFFFVTGVYHFVASCDDQAEVYLSTDDTSANKKKIIFVSAYNSFHQWDKYEKIIHWIELGQGQAIGF